MVSSPMEMALFCALSKNSVKRCAGVQGGARSRRRGSRQGCGAGREVLGEARQSRERLRPRAAVSLPAWLAAREGSKHHEPKKRLVADRNGGAGKSSRHRHRTPGDRKSVVEGKRVAVLVDLGCRRIIKKKNKKKKQ